ncbi:Glucose-6-phosphatase 3 [Echinococcus granulosus]|uniref:glucose-6-phosphatase n=1 Tax=Echinococcus granulosus TaxID=6210 RepID=W6UC56_ECHGR|nr:Glucose-6-phosphatase 3 [Echinococcus granulosus]EUB58191.1 Glucose-6-phosphatase 3 [Echinococcus granulosus]
MTKQNILKAICGERPFWWVKSHKSANLTLKQFDITCETGPGSPSGHCMVFVAGWLPLILYIKHRRKKLGATLYALLIICTIVVGVSRLYTATHFPHQVIEGSVAGNITQPHYSAFEGALIGQAFYQWTMRYTLKCTTTTAASTDLRPSALISPQRLTIIGTLSFVLGEAIGATLNFLGVDVDRSLRMARTHCDRREWVHPSTSVEASYARVTGALLGLAAALIFRPLTVRSLKTPPLTVKRVIFPCVMCTVACYYCQRLISLLAPFFKCLLGYIPLGSQASFLFYMGAIGASCPLVVALVFSSLLDQLVSCKAQRCTSTKRNATVASSSHDSEASTRGERSRSRPQH